MIILFILVPFLLFSCSKGVEREVIDMKITSPDTHLACRIENFQLDNLWFDVTYSDNFIEQKIVTEDMLSKEDLAKLSEPGRHIININYNNKSLEVELYLYDSNLLSNSHLFVVHKDLAKDYYLKQSAYDIEKPTKDNLYFYNWYLDETFQKPYSNEVNSEVISLYPRYSTLPTFRVRFYHESILIKEEYVNLGSSATPPVMESYDDYIFYGWDKDFSNIQSNLDVYSIYQSGSCEVIYYDLNGDVLSRQVVKIGESTIPPIPKEELGKLFIGWSNDGTNVLKSMAIYPIYASILETITVRFFAWTLDNFLYETQIMAGDSIEFNYQMPNYVVQDFSCDLTEITSDTDVIVNFRPIEYEYYYQGELITKLPFNSSPPAIPKKDNAIGKWEKRENSEYVYDLIYYSYYDFTFFIETQKYGMLEVGYNEFIKLGPSFYLGITKNSFEFYDWYLDYNYTNKIDDFSLINSGDVIYGRSVSTPSYYSDAFFDKTLVEIDGVLGYSYSLNSSDHLIGFIPNTFNDLPVLEVTSSIISNLEYCFLSAEVRHFKYENERLKKIKSLIISENNHYLYIKDGILFKNSFMKDELIMFIEPKSSFQLTLDYALNENSFDFANIDTLIIPEGMEVLDKINFTFATIRHLNLSSTIREIRLKIISQELEVINFNEQGSLEYINFECIYFSNIKNLILPASVKFIDNIWYLNKKSSLKFQIPEDHPYFVKTEDYILNKTKDTLILALNPAENNDIIVPNSIKYLFLNCFREVKCQTLVLPSTIKGTVSYNGYNSITKEYTNYWMMDMANISVPDDIDMDVLHGITDSKWYKNQKGTEIMIGSMLIGLNIKGEYTLNSEIKRVFDRINIQQYIDFLYIPKEMKEIASIFENLSFIGRIIYI